MNENNKILNFKWFNKLKNVKHIEVYITIIFILIILIIYFSGNMGNKKNKAVVEENKSITITNYKQSLESDLCEILSSIGGVSDIKVMITFDMLKANINESIITMEKFPNIKGIIITGKGLNETDKKLKVLHAIESVLDVTNGNVEILSSE